MNTSKILGRFNNEKATKEMLQQFKTAFTDLPGMKNMPVIVSCPQLIKENSQYSSTDKGR